MISKNATSKWEVKKFREVADVITGTTPSTNHPEYYGGTIPFVTPSNLDADLPIMKTPVTLTETGGNKARLLPIGAVMVCCIGATIGKIGYAGTRLTTNQQINSLVFDPGKVYSRFGYHYCRTLKSSLKQISSSTTLPIVNKGQFQELTIPVPPLPEQERIATVLDKADRLLRLRRYASQLGEGYMQSAFVEIFGDLIKNEKGWDQVRFDKVCKIDAEMVDPRKDEYKKLLHVGSANIESVTGRVLDLHTAEKDGLISGNFLITPEHILFSKIRPKLCKVAYPQIHGLCSADIYPIRITSKKCNAFYLLHWLRSPEFTEIVASRAEARAQIPKVNRSELSQISIPIPPLAEQERFAAVVARYERLRAQQREAERQVEMLFQSLLAQSFSVGLSQSFGG